MPAGGEVMGLRVYLALGVLTVCLALGATALWYRAQAISAQAQAAQARADLATARQANAEAVKTISALQEQSRIDSRLTASLVEEMRKINDGLAAQAAQLTELESQNADVRAYLDAAVPADLRKLRGR